MKQTLLEPLTWLAILAGISFLFFLIRGLRVVRHRVVTRILIALSCFYIAITVFPSDVPETMLQLTATFIVSVVILLIIADLASAAFFKVKQSFPAKQKASLPLPEYLMEICKALEMLARTRTGALMVLERGVRLQGFVNSGMPFESQIKTEALQAIFSPGSPLHDGAVIISQGRIRRVKAIIPLTTNTEIPMGMGTRHRSAMSITEKTDAIALVVSEERGEIGVCYQGQLVKATSREQLQNLLKNALKGESILD
ncbi:diadenylate cyclase [Candidatus Omnitrophota bacterium]